MEPTISEMIIIGILFATAIFIVIEDLLVHTIDDIKLTKGSKLAVFIFSCLFSATLIGIILFIKWSV